MTHVRAHERKPRAKSPAYIATHAALRADVARDWAQRAERPITTPVETVGSASEAEIYQIAELNHWFAPEQGGMA